MQDNKVRIQIRYHKWHKTDDMLSLMIWLWDSCINDNDVLRYTAWVITICAKK